MNESWEEYVARQILAVLGANADVEQHLTLSSQQNPQLSSGDAPFPRMVFSATRPPKGWVWVKPASGAWVLVPTVQPLNATAYAAFAQPFDLATSSLAGTSFDVAMRDRLRVALSGFPERTNAAGTELASSSSLASFFRAFTATGTMSAGDITFGSSQLGAVSGSKWEVIILALINESSAAATTWSFGEGASGNPTAGVPDYSGGMIWVPGATAGMPILLPPRTIWFNTATNNTAVRFRAQRGAATDVVRILGIGRNF